MCLCGQCYWGFQFRSKAEEDSNPWHHDPLICSTPNTFYCPFGTEQSVVSLNPLIFSVIPFIKPIQTDRCMIFVGLEPKRGLQRINYNAWVIAWQGRAWLTNHNPIAPTRSILVPVVVREAWHFYESMTFENQNLIRRQQCGWNILVTYYMRLR